MHGIATRVAETHSYNVYGPAIHQPNVAIEFLELLQGNSPAF